jgi:hypothetical protein
MPDWLQQILAAGLLLAGLAVQRWWGRKDAGEAARRVLDADRAGRQEIRSEEAAKELLVHIEAAFEELARYPRGQVPPQDARVSSPTRSTKQRHCSKTPTCASASIRSAR